MAAKLTAKKPTPLISKAFKRDFPEFVARAESLGVRIQPSPDRRRGKPLTYWLDGYLQLTGYDTKSGGAPFTYEDAVENIDEALTEIEEGRAKAATMTVSERFAEVIAETRKMSPHYGMIGEVRLPCGDRSHVWFRSECDAFVYLRDIGKVATVEFSWGQDGPMSEMMPRLCDQLDADFARRQALKEHGDENG